MRRLAWTTAAFLLTVLPPFAAAEPPAALTEEEAADGWRLLFDGANTDQLLISGDWDIEDGALVFNGPMPAQLRFRPDLGDEFTLTLLYRVEGTSTPQIKTHWGGLFGMGMTGTSLPRPSRPEEWQELRCEAIPGEDGQVAFHITTRPAAGGGVATAALLGGQRGGTFSFEMPPGTKVSFRAIKARPDPEAGNLWRTPWPYFGMAAAALLLLIVGLLALARRLRNRALAP